MSPLPLIISLYVNAAPISRQSSRVGASVIPASGAAIKGLSRRRAPIFKSFFGFIIALLYYIFELDPFAVMLSRFLFVLLVDDLKSFECELFVHDIDAADAAFYERGKSSGRNDFDFLVFAADLMP